MWVTTPAYLSVLVLLVAGGVESQQSRTVQCVPGKTQFPNPNDRHSFYKCDAGGNPVLFQCPAGTWFNPRLEVCDWDTGNTGGTSGQNGNANNNSNGNSNSNGNNNNNNGRPTTPSGWNTGQNTPRPTNPWNIVPSTTRRPNNNGNTNGRPVTQIDSTVNWWSGPVDEEEGGNNQNGNGSGGNNSGPVIGGSCDPQGPRSIANPSDCGSFFTCTRQGRLQLTTCPSGLYFSPQSNTCQRNIPSGCTVNDAWTRGGSRG